MAGSRQGLILIGRLALLAIAAASLSHAQVFGSANADRFRGRYISSCVPVDGQGYTWSASTQRWICTTPNTAVGGLKFILQTADALAPNSQALGALASGVLKNTTGTGVLSIVTGSASDCVKVDGSSGACGSGGGAGPTVWKLDGSTWATESTFEILTGFGFTYVTSNPSGVARIQPVLDESAVTSARDLQSGKHVSVVESSSSPTDYAGGVDPVLTAYSPGTTLNWLFTHACAGSTTTRVNVNGLGFKRLFQYDGTSNPTAADCAANRLRTIKYVAALDSGNGGFVLDGGASGTGGTSTLAWDLEIGACSSGGGAAGLAWNDEGNTGQSNCDATATNHLMTWQFIQNTTGILTRQFRFPSTWNSGVGANFKFSIVNIDGGTTTGNVKFSAKIACFADGSTWTTAPYNAVASATVAMTTAFVVKDFSITSIPISGTSTCHAGDQAILWWSRDNGAGSNLGTYVKAMAPILELGVN